MNFPRNIPGRRFPALMLGLAFFLAGNSEALSWIMVPTHDWTISYGDQSIGFREWEEPNFTAISRSSGVIPMETRTEIVIGDFCPSVSARIEVVAGGIALFLVSIAILAGGGFRKWQEWRQQSAGRKVIGKEALE
ncbi:MAG: hypothetical protein HKN23_05975 [Verrucomicrobiales bacterium]|nr:hypothetical protein [Verrucomicrobiales bacterium]